MAYPRKTINVRLNDLPRTLSRVPHAPGVYVFRNRKNTVLYVGKAVNLSNRVRQYFTPSSQKAVPKIQLLVGEIASIDVFKTSSEFEALLLEAKFIRKHLPKYNARAKDDKSPLYIAIPAGDPLPTIRFVRRTALGYSQVAQKSVSVFGPFQSAHVARGLMSTIRHVVPFCTQRRRDGKPCFYTHLGLCGPCPSLLSKAPKTKETDRLRSVYRRNVRRLCDILSGRSGQTLHKMEREIKQLSRLERYEQANRVQDQVRTLTELITRRFNPVALTTNDDLARPTPKEACESLAAVLRPYFPSLSTLARIECIDISNLLGRGAVGSLVVLTDGVIDTSQYRRFAIRTVGQSSDVAMIREVLTRRLRHKEWPFPDLLVIDGGKPQVRVAQEVLSSMGYNIATIGLAKRFEEIIVGVRAGYATIRLALHDPALRIIQQLRDEAHRFALSYHRTVARRFRLTAARASASMKRI